MSTNRISRIVLAWLTLFAYLAAPCVAWSADAPTYTLGAQDKIRLKVYEWRATVETVFEWTSLNAEFTVGASGAVSLPILGEIPAAGQTPAALAKEIGERLKSLVSLSVSPNIGVEVVQYRPFYILGGVNKPGEYPYRPDLTVLQALSIAGGMMGSGESGGRVGRDVITRRGELRETETEVNALLAKKARLEAELGNAEKLQFPASLEQRKTEPLIAVLMQQERTLFDTRRNALRAQIDVMNQLKAFLEKEILSIDAQIKSQKNEEDLLKKEIGNIASLVSRGLAAAPRQLELERAASRLEGERLRLESTLLKARQDISRTEIEILDARNKRANEAAAELRETQTKLEQASTKYDTAAKLLSEAQVAAPQPLVGRSAKAQPAYTIVRTNGSQRKEMSATELTRVEPGDTVKVELPFDDISGIRSSTQ